MATARTHWRSRCCRALRDDRGNSLVEFGAVSILLCSMLAAIMQFGLGMWVYDSAAHLAREGARYGMVHGSMSGMTPSQQNTAISTYLKDLSPGLGSQVTITTTWWNGTTQLSGTASTDNQPGNAVSVKVSKSFNLTGGVLTMGTITLASTSRMVISY